MKGIKRIFGERSGVHLLVQMEDKRTEQELTDCAGQAGIRVYPLSEYCLDDRTCETMMLLGYATMKEEEIRTAAGLLERSWERGKR